MNRYLKLGALSLLAASLFGCSGESGAADGTNAENTAYTVEASGIHGVWYSVSDPAVSVTFNEDGTVSDNFRLDGERVSAYAIEDNGTIRFTVVDDTQYDSVLRTADKSEALGSDHYYFLDASELVLDKIEYSRTQMEAVATDQNQDRSIVGAWSDNGNSVTFNQDGTITGTLYIDDDIASAYSVEADGSIIFTMDMVNGEEPYLLVYRTDDMNIARDDDNYYYLGGNTLIVDQQTFTAQN